MAKKNQATKLHTEVVTKPTATTTKMDYDAQMTALRLPENADRLATLHEMTKDIKVDDGGSLRGYGREIGQLMSKTSEQILQQNHSNAIGDRSAAAIVQLNTDLAEQMKKIDLDQLRGKNKFQLALLRTPIVGPIAKHFMWTTERLEIKYNPIIDNIGIITQEMSNNGLKALEENRQIGADIAEIEQALITSHEKVLALKVLEMEQQELLDEMHDNPEKYEHSEILRQEEFVNRVGRRVNSMIQTEANLQISLIELEGTRSANYQLAERADDIVEHVIPNMKLSIGVAIHQGETKQMANSQNLVIDTANQMMVETAKSFATNMVETEKLMNRDIYDYETLVASVDSLKKASKEIKDIRAKKIASTKENRDKMLKIFRDLETEMTEN